MNKPFKLSTLTAAVLASLISTPLLAAPEEDGAKADTSDVEVIEITGFKSSLRKAMNAKRFSDGVSDSIHAEDVGKSTDQNIADALSRVTGISVQESDGEGARISVRGTNASLNQVSLNGIALTSGGNGDPGSLSSDQSVDLSTFSSDILSAIDVQKTAAADQDEGSLGANIVLKTARPLSMRNDRTTANVEARYNEYSGDADYRASGSISRKLLDEKLGFIFTLTDETQTTRSDDYRASWTNRQTSSGIDPTNVRDYDTGKLFSELLSQEELDNLDSTPASAAKDGLLSPVAIDNQSYRINLNERDRTTATLGLQFLPSDDTEIMFDVNYSKQTVNLDNNAIQMQNAPTNSANLTCEDSTDDGIDDCADEIIDPQDQWHTVRGNILTKHLERNGRYKINRQIAGTETENKVATLSIDHNITDDLKATVLMGYSRTESESLPNAFVNLDSGSLSDRINIVNELGPNDDPLRKVLTPVGYDCGTGGVCNFITSEGLHDFYLGTDGVRKGQTNNNGNVLDPNLFQFQAVRQIDDETTDENKSIFVDFDWNVYWFDTITSVEFGGKMSNRHKVVHSESTALTAASLSDPENFDDDIEIDDDFQVSYLGLITNEAFPVNDFMDGIVNGNNKTGFLPNGWAVVDPLEVFEIMQAGDIVSPDKLRLTRNPGNSREIEQKSAAIYGKLNFEFMDGRLTGNIGARYVRTENDSSAYQSINFNKGTAQITPYDLLFTRGLGNTELPVCGYVDDRTTVQAEDRAQYGDLPEANSCVDWKFLFEEKPQFEQRLVNGVERDFIDPAQLTMDNDNLKLWIDYTGDAPVVLKNEPNIGRRGFLEWVDRSTNPATIQPTDGTYVFDENGFIDRQAHSRFFLANSSNSSLAKSTHYNFLPSLSLNYTFSDDLIARFGISKTMARPTFDNIRPSISLSESIFNQDNAGNLRNPQLEPLESSNLDLSLEWYFSESGLLSAAIFHKDMSGFAQEVTTKYLVKDIRNDKRLQYETDENGTLIPETAYLDGVENFSELLMLPEFDELGNSISTPATSGCMPFRISHSGTGAQNPFDFGCKLYNVSEVHNADSTTTGLELSYTQNYDFLPGFLSGLGANINYTYSKSETDPVTNQLGVTFDALPQPYTPTHSANTTVFWEQDGLMLRLAHRYTSVQLVDEIACNGACTVWLDDTSRLDLSASYRINKTFSVVFNATNLTDDTRDMFISSRDYLDIHGQPWREGNIQNESGYDKSKIFRSTRNGRIYRLGIRANF